MKKTFKEHWPAFFISCIVFAVIIHNTLNLMNENKATAVSALQPDHWIAPSLYLNSTGGFDRKELLYGQDLIANTASYFGPNGSVSTISNGMNCQNCHLDAGTKPWGNNYCAVFSCYPKFRERSGSIESVAKRVNDCFERSLNGAAIDSTGKEMKAIIAYISWLGHDVPKQTKPAGAGITELSYLDRAADQVAGAKLYAVKCESCHAPNGEGIIRPNNIGYIYPPLWGAHSYNTGAGFYRLSRLAGFIKDNMPFDIATHKDPSLSNEEAWDLAAFVNAQRRPQKYFSADWSDISKKPADYPFGPYTDGFTEQQHKFGPFPPIVGARK